MAVLSRKKHSRMNSNINVTPMVDVMLVLLIIFMVITPMLQHGKTVDLAKTNHPASMADADREDALVVAILHDGSVFIGDELVTRDALTQKLKERLANHLNQIVYVKSDARARYEYVVDVVDDLRSAGADELGLLTEQSPHQHVTL